MDTSSAACSVALFDDTAGGAGLIDWRHAEIGRGHAEHLLTMIAALDGGGRADRILVGCGPGSFTGVRVGIAAALGLGLGWQVPVTGFGSLALVAAAAFVPGQPLLVAMEGGHGEYFVQHFGPGGVVAAPAISMPPEAAAAAGEHHVAGSRAAALVALRGFGSASALLPDARHAMAVTATEMGWPARPLYGRAPDAVAKRA